MTSLSIVVPSYRRPARLARSLAALVPQCRVGDEVLVVCRRGDGPTRAVADATAGVRVVEVQAPGVLAALRAGARSARRELIGFVDDDAEARDGWLDGIVEHFADPAVGGVCGRDVVGPAAAPASDVGRITAAGKLVGNHHLGAGPARDVDVLKGANMVFRRAALALPDGLRGEGAQVHFEVACSLWATGRGWRLVYDPALVVDHLPAPRFDDDARTTPSSRAIENAAFNLVLCLGVLRPDLRRCRLAYGLLAGDKGAPGLLRAARAVVERDAVVAARLRPSLRGQVAAHRLLARDAPALELHCYPSAGVEARAPAPPGGRSGAERADARGARGRDEQ